jgi:feruloyl-CoA synthase
VALLFYPNPTLPRAEVEAAVRAGVAAYNAQAKGASNRVARALVLADAPDPGAGEITDKGYISQAIARAKWADRIAELYANPPPEGTLVF